MTAPLGATPSEDGEFGVGSTPTFFINGKKMTGAPTIEEFDKSFAALLKS